jgi:hypothetical protein
LVLEQEPHAKTCASLVLRVNAERSRWKTANSADVVDFHRNPFSRLLDGSEVHVEIIRSRSHRGIRTDFQNGRGMRDNSMAIFETKEIFGF